MVRITIGSKRQAFFFATKREALEFKLRSKREPSILDEVRRREPKSLIQFALEYLERKSHELKVATRLKYSESIRLYIGPQIGTLDISEIRRIHVEDYKSWLASRKMSQSSRVFHFDFLKSLLKRAHEYELIAKNPALGVRSFSKPEPKEDYWSENELRRFMQFHVKNPRLPLYLIAASCGLRLGEAFGLKKSDIDFGEGTIVIRRSYDQKAKEMSTTKTKRKRTVYLADDLREFLFPTILKSDGDFVIPRDLPGLKDFKHTSRTFRRDCEQAGVKPIRFHGLRHTWATLFMEKTGDPFLTQRLLGHRSLSMTARYAHTSQDHIKKNRNVLSVVPDAKESIDELEIAVGSKMVTNLKN